MWIPLSHPPRAGPWYCRGRQKMESTLKWVNLDHLIILVQNLISPFLSNCNDLYSLWAYYFSVALQVKLLYFSRDLVLPPSLLRSHSSVSSSIGPGLSVCLAHARIFWRGTSVSITVSYSWSSESWELISIILCSLKSNIHYYLPLQYYGADQ